MRIATIESEGRYPDRLQFRVPRGLVGAVKAAADKRLTSPAEWARQALLRSLEAEGVGLTGCAIETDDVPTPVHDISDDDLCAELGL